VPPDDLARNRHACIARTRPLPLTKTRRYDRSRWWTTRYCADAARGAGRHGTL